MQIVSIEDSRMKIQICFLEEKKRKNISKCRLLKFLPRVLSIILSPTKPKLLLRTKKEYNSGDTCERQLL